VPTNVSLKDVRKPARAVREYSAGGVVFRIVDGKVEFLLIEDLKGRWSVPKGHVEAGETLEQTAVREIGEETGLHNTRILEKLDKVHFFYRFEGRLIFMTTFIFLIEAIDPDEPVVVEESEGIVGARWFAAETAQQVLEYKDLKGLMARSVAIIKERQLV
jgi:diadenosine hexaphosphate hydrolase (ATP-forming)